jgi:hypothetical protein
VWGKERIWHKRNRCLKHVNVDRAPKAGFSALDKRRQYSATCIHTCQIVGNRRTGDDWVAVEKKRRGSRQSLCDSIVGRTVLVGPGGSETADGAIDQTRIFLCENRPADAEPFHDARPEVFDENVGAPDQAKQNILSLRASDIESDAFLVSVVRQEVRGMILPAEGAERVASVRILELDDVRAEIPQQHAGERAGDHCRRFDNLDAFEG